MNTIRIAVAMALLWVAGALAYYLWRIVMNGQWHMLPLMAICILLMWQAAQSLFNEWGNL